MSPELAQPVSAAGRKRSHWGNGVEQRATCKQPISIHRISMARWIAELRGFLVLLPSLVNFRWLKHSFFFSCVRSSRKKKKKKKVFLLMHNITKALCYSTLSGFGLDLHPSGNYSSSSLWSVSWSTFSWCNVLPWVIRPASSQWNKWAGIKVPLMLFSGGRLAFLERRTAVVWESQHQNSAYMKVMNHVYI